MLLKNRDLLIFQVLNWGLNFITFTLYLKFVNNFSQIIQAEIIFGALGAFLLSYSIKGSQNEMTLLYMRLGGAFLSLCMIGVAPNAYILASIAVLAIPAHLPIRYGFSMKIYVVLCLLRLLPIALIHSNADKVILYFLPNIFYGFFLYGVFFDKLKAKTKECAIDYAQMLTHFGSIATLYYLQSLYVAKIMLLAPVFVVAEKLLRSLYGFMQPHLLRYFPNIKSGQNLYIFFFILLLFVHNPYFLIVVPAIIDSYLIVSGQKKIRDVIATIIFCALIYTQR